MFTRYHLATLSLFLSRTFVSGAMPWRSYSKPHEYTKACCSGRWANCASMWRKHFSRRQCSDDVLEKEQRAVQCWLAANNYHYQSVNFQLQISSHNSKSRGWRSRMVYLCWPDFNLLCCQWLFSGCTRWGHDAISTTVFLHAPPSEGYGDSRFPVISAVFCWLVVWVPSSLALLSFPLSLLVSLACDASILCDSICVSLYKDWLGYALPVRQWHCRFRLELYEAST